jgi:Uma2 family endonuclease
MATLRTQIGPGDHGRPMTLDEFHDAQGQAGYLYELARGVLEVVEVPGDDHAQVVDNLHECFSVYRRQNSGLILRIGHGSDVRLEVRDGAGSDRHPDLGVVFQDAAPDARGRRRPSLVVEVVSPGERARERDYQEKRQEYFSLGIKEYWIVDFSLDQVMVLVHPAEERSPRVERAFRGDETIVSDLLPGFAGRVSELWVGVRPSEGLDDRD